MMISEHFDLSEFLVSEYAARHRIDMTPRVAVHDALRRLALRVLEPVRAHFDRPVVITSGYRPPALNRAIGGAASSQHVKGEAADFHIPGIPNYEVASWMERSLNYDQLILEFVEAGRPYSGWVHVSYREPYRNEELTAQRYRSMGRMRTRYLQGLVR